MARRERSFRAARRINSKHGRSNWFFDLIACNKKMGRPMTLALTAAEIDALAKKAEEPFDYHFSPLFRKEADAQGVSSEKAEAFRLIGSALGFRFRAMTQFTRSVMLKPSPSNKPHGWNR
jgi:uncharacterized protein YciW